ncbi:hypothetical protein HC502_25255, partial [Escherichia coli]|nr:hypothetical protein [Escherichia coli]
HQQKGMISLSPPTICNSAGNRHLHKERLAVYRWHASFICSGNTMPIVLVDWSDIREQKRLMVLRASVALHGRSVTLY